MVLGDPRGAPAAGKEPSACMKGGTCWEVRFYLSPEFQRRVPQPFPCVVALVAASAPQQ